MTIRTYWGQLNADGSTPDPVPTVVLREFPAPSWLREKDVLLGESIEFTWPSAEPNGDTTFKNAPEFVLTEAGLVLYINGTIYSHQDPNTLS